MRIYLTRVALIFGLLGGFFNFLYGLAIYSLDPDKLLMARFSDFWIPVVVILFALFYIRKTRRMGLVFWEGLIVAFLVNTVLALASATFTWLYATLDANWLAAYIESSLQFIERAKPVTLVRLGQEEYTKQIEAARHTTLFSLWVDEVIKKIFYGLIICPVTAIIMKKTPPAGFRQEDYKTD